MKIQLDIPEKINYLLKIDKTKKRLNNLQEMVVIILKKHYNTKGAKND